MSDTNCNKQINIDNICIPSSQFKRPSANGVAIIACNITNDIIKNQIGPFIKRDGRIALIILTKR